MSYYQNGQQYPHYSQSGPPLPPLPPLPPQHPPPPRQDDTSPNASSPYQVNGLPYVEHSYANSSFPPPNPALAARQDGELYMGASNPPQPVHRHSSTSSIPYSPTSASPAYSHNTYNPQDYANQMSPATPQIGTSPVLGRRPSAASAHQQYNPADYADPGLQRMSSSASYQHGYSPGYQPTSQPAYTPPPVPQASAGARQSSIYANRPAVSTSFSTHYNSTAPPPLPAIPSAGESPSEDWGRLPGMTRYTSRRYHRDSNPQSPPLPSPPTHHSRNSSGFSYSPLRHSPSPGAPPPVPPPHGHRLSISESLASRPLPRLPSNASPTPDDYFSGGQSSVQQDLENQILASVGATSSPAPKVCYLSSCVGVIRLTYFQVNGAPNESEDSDLEALAGLEAMREAERQEQEDIARRASGQSTLFSSISGRRESVSRQQPKIVESDSDVPPVDIGSMGGGWNNPMLYGDTSANLGTNLTVGRNDSLHGRQSSQTVSTSGSRRKSGNASESEGYSVYNGARVDSFGTGGLADPSLGGRRLSFDEGDEKDHIGEPGAAGYEFFHPGITNRPLPPPPAEVLRHSQSSSAVPHYHDWRSEHAPFARAPSYPVLSHSPAIVAPNRHTSLINHSATPPMLAPSRAITDADERRLKKRPQSVIGDSGEESATTNNNVAFDVPRAVKGFKPSQLTAYDFNKCKEPWAMSSLTEWLKALVKDEQYLKKPILIDGLVALFTYKVRTMNVADAETLAAQIIDEMQANQTLYEEEEWLFFSETPSIGVIYQLTSSGCYAPTVHSYNLSTRCYSHHCQRTEKKIDLSTEIDVGLQEDWIVYWKINKEDCEKYDRKEVARQNILHELVQKEENFLKELGVLQTLYRDGLARANPPVMGGKKLTTFIQDVFGKIDLLKKANEDHLVPQVKYRQKEQGPFVVGFSGIFREWIRKSKIGWIEYASAYPDAIDKMRSERDINMLFRSFLDSCQADPRSKRLDFNHWMKLPLTHLQHIPLLLTTVLDKSIVDNDEKRNLLIAIEEIKQVTLECDTRVGDGMRKVELKTLQTKLKLRPDMPKVDLNLNHLGRELIHQGELLRAGHNKFNLLETQAILFDHLLILAKPAKSSDQKSEEYDVSRSPIPMDLLILESRDDDPVVKSSLAGVTKVTQTTDKLAKTLPKDATPGPLQHSLTSTSLASMQSTKSAPPIVTTLNDSKDDKIMYPFRVRHLGKEMYTLYAQSAQGREEWCNRITDAKTKHAHSLFSQNAEPFKLRVIADTAFAYEATTSGPPSIPIHGTPLDRAVREVETMYANYGRPGPICRAKVNCATSFTQSGGKEMFAVGTDYGVYISAVGDPRGWNKVWI
jgi:RhoGEF domain/Pleckstrin homology domain